MADPKRGRNSDFVADPEDLIVPVPSHVTRAAQGVAGVPARETAAEAAARIRSEREAGTRPRALDGTTKKLEIYGTVPGYHLALMNDNKNRIMQAELHGWTMVQADEIDGVNGDVTSFNNDPGSQVRFVVGSKENGEAMYAYLMKLPEEIWRDDLDAKEARDAYVDQQIRGGHAPGETGQDTEQRYNVRTSLDQVRIERTPTP